MKYVHNFVATTAGRGVAGSFEADKEAPGMLFDLTEDPFELHDIAGSLPAAVQRMCDALLANIEPLGAR